MLLFIFPYISLMQISVIHLMFPEFELASRLKLMYVTAITRMSNSCDKEISFKA